jgi:uncharacterized protein (DUF433 family)
MNKPVVDAKPVLEDLRSGMSDSALMKKYNLSRRSLGKLIQKLVELGVVRQLRVEDLLRDIGSGVTHFGLMKKYRLTPRALERLFNEMTDAGILPFRPRQAREKTKVGASAIVRDIQAGLSQTELMGKHRLSFRGLQSALWKLVQAGALTWAEVLNAFPDADTSVAPHRKRQRTRSYPILSVRAYEEANPSNKGKVKDLSERGIGVSGIITEVAQYKALVVVPDGCMNLKPFKVQGECRWFCASVGFQPCAAGFEITAMDVHGLERLQELVQLTTLMFD